MIIEFLLDNEDILEEVESLLILYEIDYDYSEGISFIVREEDGQKTKELLDTHWYNYKMKEIML